MPLNDLKHMLRAKHTHSLPITLTSTGITETSTSMSLMSHLMPRLLWPLLIMKKNVHAKYLRIYSEKDRRSFQCNEKVTGFSLAFGGRKC